MNLGDIFQQDLFVAADLRHGHHHATDNHRRIQTGLVKVGQHRRRFLERKSEHFELRPHVLHRRFELRHRHAGELVRGSEFIDGIRALAPEVHDRGHAARQLPGVAAEGVRHLEHLIGECFGGFAGQLCALLHGDQGLLNFAQTLRRVNIQVFHLTLQVVDLVTGGTEFEVELLERLSEILSRDHRRRAERFHAQRTRGEQVAHRPEFLGHGDEELLHPGGTGFGVFGLKIIGNVHITCVIRGHGYTTLISLGTFAISVMRPR